MADSRITTWTETVALDGTESLAVDDGGNKKILAKNLLVPVASSAARPNYSLNAAHNTIDPAVESSLIAGPGQAEFPNVVGSGTKPIEGAPGWTDEAYTPGKADLATISGGYDHVNSQLAGTIAGGGHHYMPESTNGHGVISGGSKNYNGGGYSVVAGGSLNTIELDANFATISGGQANQIAVASSGSIISGGERNTISTSANAQLIAGGSDNTISTSSSGNAIFAGETNSITGSANNAAILASNGSTTSGNYSVVSGLSCAVTANYSVTVGGSATNAGEYSLVVGNQVAGTIDGAITHSGRVNTATGDAQSVQFTMSRIASNSSVLYLSMAGSSNYTPIPNNTAWSGEVYLSGIVTTAGTGAAVGDTVGYKIPFQCKNIAGTGSRQLGSTADAVLLVDEIGVAGPPEVNIHSTALLRVGVFSHVDAVVKWCARIQLTSVTL